MAGSTAEIFTPDGDADEERGVAAAELYANNFKTDGQLRTTEDAAIIAIPRQRDPIELPAHPIVTKPKAARHEGGKALYGTFDKDIRYAGGLSVKAAMRGRDIIKYRRGLHSTLGRQSILHIFPGGR